MEVKVERVERKWFAFTDAERALLVRGLHALHCNSNCSFFDVKQYNEQGHGCSEIRRQGDHGTCTKLAEALRGDEVKKEKESD